MSVAMLDPVDQWSEVDEDYVDFPVVDDDTDVDEDEDLTAEEESIPEDTTPVTLFWASYELWGRNLDAGTPWDRLAVEDFDGELNVEVEGLTAGASWEFRIRLIDSNGRYSPYSEPLQISLPVDFTPPPAPTAPLVDETAGYVTLGWDGDLTGAIPEDLSHTNLYVQQDGGDPRLVHQFYSSGSWGTGSLPEAPHVAFLTAVDTTGNESPWSAEVSFTPTPPVDRQEIEARVQESEDKLAKGIHDLDVELREEIETAAGNIIIRGTSEPTPSDAEGVHDGARFERWTTLDIGGELTGTWTWDGTEWVEGHLSEEYLPQVAIGQGTYGELDGDRLMARSVGTAKVAVGNWDNLVLDPRFTEGDDFWTTQDSVTFRTSGSGYRVADLTQSISSGGDSYLANDGRRWKLSPGEYYHFSAMVYTTSDLAADDARLWFIRTPGPDGGYENGTAGAYGTSLNAMTQLDSGWQKVHWTAYGGDYGPDRHFYLQSRVQGYESGQLLVAEPVVRRAYDGQLIVDGEIHGQHVNGQSVAGEVGSFIEINADQIRANSYQGHVMTAPVVQSHDADETGWKLDPASGFRMYDLNGDLTVRLDGEDNLLTGRLETSPEDGQGVIADTGDISYYSAAANGRVSATDAPYIRVSNGQTDERDQPTIANDGGNLVIAPGVKDESTGMRADVVIDGPAQIATARVPGWVRTPEVDLEDSSGSVNGFLLHSGMQLGGGDVTLNTSTGLRLGGGDVRLSTGSGLRIESSSSAQPAGIWTSGPRTHIRGRMDDADAENDMIRIATLGSYSLSPGSSTRGSLTWGAPTPGGSPRPQATGHVSSGSQGYDNWRTVIVNTAARSASGCNWVARAPQDENGGDVTFWVYLLGLWN